MSRPDPTPFSRALNFVAQPPPSLVREFAHRSSCGRRISSQYDVSCVSGTVLAHLSSERRNRRRRVALVTCAKRRRTKFVEQQTVSMVSMVSTVRTFLQGGKSGERCGTSPLREARAAATSRFLVSCVPAQADRLCTRRERATVYAGRVPKECSPPPRPRIHPPGGMTGSVHDSMTLAHALLLESIKAGSFRNGSSLSQRSGRHQTVSTIGTR